MPAVQVAGLTVRYGPPGTAPAVDGVDLMAEAGEVLVVLGPNGAGKTSAVETLEGYRRPVAGDVEVLGLDPHADHAALTGRIGVMLQRGGVYPMLAPRHVLDLFAGYYARPVPTPELLDLMGLQAVAQTPWRHLSGGEQQRLSLALALIGRPEVAFLDEPTAGVDPEGRIAIRRVVAGLKESGVCVLMTTHELTEAERMADRIVILSHGRIVREGTPEELTERTGTGTGASTGTGTGTGTKGGHTPTTTTVAFGAPPDLDCAALATAVTQATAATEPATATETSPGRYRIEAAAPGPALAAALATYLADRGAALTDLVVGQTLEDVYFAAVGAHPGQQPDDEQEPGTTGSGSGSGSASRRRRGQRRRARRASP
jgi:ABC-2 type transport system ATP-binding protein